MTLRKAGWMLLLVLGLAQAGAMPARSAEIPPWLPRYDLGIHVDVQGSKAFVRQRVTWHNRHHRPTDELIFNAHSHYALLPQEIGLGAKTLEILRMSPGEGLDLDGSCLEVESVTMGEVSLPFSYLPENSTALRVQLPQQIACGDSIVIEIRFSFRLPHKMGRWGQWCGVTFLSNWLPVLAVYDEAGWHPVPYIPWHQPFFNEAGLYTARLLIADDQKVACSLPIACEKRAAEGMKEVEFAPACLRDFALLASAKYIEARAQACDVDIRCVALPEHQYYAEKIVHWIAEAIPIYTRWIGPYPYKHFTIAESFFGWAGNECAGLVMIDYRVFGAPHLAAPYVEYLVSHELLHQWFYNAIGTNGYCETWMDEGMVVYLSHRLMDKKRGKNDCLLEYPNGLGWLPNIHRNTYRNYSYRGAYARGERCATVQEMPKYEHLVNLMSTCYDRGSRIVGMIEERMGETAFFDFLHIIYNKYYFRILRVADLQCELEAYTGRSWEQFFQEWLYGSGVSDWSVQNVKLQPLSNDLVRERYAPQYMTGLLDKLCGTRRPWRAKITVCQKAQINEPTTLGICIDGTDNYQIRLPLDPGMPELDIEDPPAHISWQSDNQVCIEVDLPCRPTQIAVDPDKIVVDINPTNNLWKSECRWRFTPLYTPLEETDVTNDYDRWNFIFGPGWITAGNMFDPWYTRADVIGARASFYRTQQTYGGVYTGYRTDTRTMVAGFDTLIDHWPVPHMQLGFNVEQSLTPWDGDSTLSTRGVLYSRYVFMYGSSMYLPPAHYIEGYTAMLNHALPYTRYPEPDTNHFNQQSVVGAHYHLDYLTPYWDPEGGIRFDSTVAFGLPILGEDQPYQLVDAQVSTLKYLPDWTGPLSQTRVAARLYGGAASPSNGELFTLGGSTLFRGFDWRQRQGNLVWVGSLEWRLPVVRDVIWDCCDHVASVRNMYLVPFYDVGDCYVNNQSLGNVAHALGMGFRIDVAWFSFIERTMLRLDVAQTLQKNIPTQIWFAIQQPF